MRPTPRLIRSVFAALAAITFVVPMAVLSTQEAAHALPEPSFKVTCIVTKVANDDPIVFPGQPGKSHSHTFYGARTPDAFSTVSSLLSAPTSACGRNYGIDRSAYWIPTLYKNGIPATATDGSMELTAYYRRAGAAGGALVQQAFPQGLRMIAGDARGTTPQDNVWFKCMNTIDTGRQHSLGRGFPSCGAGESLIAELQFPDCWDGRNLDSADHKSHMAFSGGSAATCPTTHPVKLPKVTFEAKYTNVNGPASSLSFSSGGAYTFHGDVFSAWDPRSFAGLVNECINVAVDCNPRLMSDINLSSVTQSQIEAQTKWASYTATPEPTPTTPTHDHSTMPTTTTTTSTTTTTTQPPTTTTTTKPTTYKIVGIGGKCLDNSGNRLVKKNPIVLYTCNGTGAQRWTYTNNTLSMSGYCLDVPGASRSPQTKVQLWTCNGTVAQTWVKQSNGALRNPNSNLCLDSRWGSTADKNPIWIYQCNGTAAQTWKFIAN